MEFILNETPSMNNIYDSDYYNQTKKYEQQLANNSYQQAKNPFKTGVVPKPAYSDMFMDTTEYNQVSSSGVRSLNGNNIPLEKFTHGNMQPFLRKGVTQNLNLDKNQEFFEKFGYNEFKTKKTEVETFFQPTSDYGLIRGMDNTSQIIRERANITELQNNYNPIQSVRVGPGLNKGYTSTGSGGFHQADSLIYAMPKNRDELRPLSNQKNSIFEIPVQGPKKSLVDNRGEVAPPSKNRPERVYKQSEDNWFKGQSYLKKDVYRSEENLKDTSRIGTHIDYYGSGKNQIRQINENDNYNKNSILIYDTEKHELAKVETPVANFTSVIKGLVAPITDAVKITFKEYFIDNPRLYGNAIPQSPEKQTTYDPVTGLMKTTIKETMVGDNDNLNLTGSKETYSALYDKTKPTVKQTTVTESDQLNLTGNEETYSDLYDEAKTTIKETLIHDGENLNLTGNKETYSALYDNTKTTIKETTIHDNYEGNLKARDKGYVNNNDKTKKTLRETLPCYDTKRNINNTIYYSTYTYDPKIVAKTTLKETMINNNHISGFISGLINGIFGGYLSKEVTSKNTQRQFGGHCEYNGSLKSAVTHIPMDRDAELNMEVDDTRELIQNKAGKYMANGSGEYKGLDKKDINMMVNKQIDMHECAEPIRNPNKIYQSRPIPIEEENLTRIVDKNNAYENRLDSSLLSSLIENPDAIKINPIRLDCPTV
jgi:hypothetical protein